MLQPQRNVKFLRLKLLHSQLKNMQAQLMTIRLLMILKAPGLMKKFQPLKKLPGQPPVLRLKINPGQLKHLLQRLKKLSMPGQLHQLRLQKLLQVPLLLLHRREVLPFLLHHK